MSHIANRLASFKDWPEELEMKPEELAEAGFYHYPHNDYIDWVSDRIEPYLTDRKLSAGEMLQM